MNKSNRIILSLFGFVLTFVSITFFLKFLYHKEIDSLYRIIVGIVLGLLVFAILYLNSKSDSIDIFTARENHLEYIMGFTNILINRFG